MTRYVYKMVGSPVGKLKLVASASGLAGILWENDHPGRVRFHPDSRDDEHPVLLEAERQLEEYFAGRRTRFALSLDFVARCFRKRSGLRC